MNQSIEITSDYKCLLAKLEDLLRHYRIAKKNDKNNVLQDRVKNKINEILAKLKAFQYFQDVETEYKNKIDQAFREVKPEAPPSAKPQREIIESQKSKQQDVPKKGFGSSSVSSYSSQSNNANQGSNSFFNSIKKQLPVVEEKPKISQQIQKSKSQSNNSIKQLKEQTKKEAQTPKMEMISSKMDPINDSMSSAKSSISDIAQKKSSISTIQNQKFNEKEKSQGSQGSQGSLLGLLDQNQSDSGDFPISLRKEQSAEKVQTPPSSLNIQSHSQSQSQRQDDFQKLSEASVIQSTIDTIIKFCCDNKQKLNSQIVFNEDIFDYINEEQGDFIYLIGVNKPQGKKMPKLYACTLMKFSIPEVQKCDDIFQKESRDFKNNIRTPIGLIIKGDNAAAIKPEHIKFLINLQCPYMIILVLKDFQQFDGVLCQFHQTALNRIRISPRKQLGQCAEQLAKKTFVLPFNQSFLPKQKTRYVITKHLNRTIANVAEEAPNAITISDNQCIRQEKNTFNYKLHTKFLVSIKTQYAIYYVNAGVVNARTSFKDFEPFKKYALNLQSKIPVIFSINLARDNIEVKKQFFDLLVQCNKTRDPNVFLNLSNIGMKKTIVVALKPDVTFEMLDTMEPILYKNFEKDTSITYCLLVINKNNAKQCQVEGKNQLIEIKAA